MEEDVYFTVPSLSSGSYTEKRSKFLAFALPVASKEDVKENIALYRRDYHDARHLCYAYILGPRGETQISNDGGEPSGTAGRPILEQLKSFGVTNTLLLVVRYFGGVKLGASGLFFAYKAAAEAALTEAKIEKKTIDRYLFLSFPYEKLDRVLGVLRKSQAHIIKQDYQLNCSISFQIRASKCVELSQCLRSIPSLLLSEKPLV